MPPSESEHLPRVIPCALLDGDPPDASDRAADWPDSGGIAGAFVRSGAFAWPQATARVVAWERAIGVAVRVDGVLPGDAIEVLLDARRWSIRPGEAAKGPSASSLSWIDGDGWEARIVIPFGRPIVAGERLPFDVVRSGGATWSGGEIIVVCAPIWIEVAPPPDRSWAPDVPDMVAAPVDARAHPQLPPRYLTSGTNEVVVRADASIPLAIFVGAISTERHGAFAAQTVPVGAHEVAVRLEIDGEGARCRDWTVVVDASDPATGEILQRIAFPRMPLVVPPLSPTEECHVEISRRRSGAPRECLPIPSSVADVAAFDLPDDEMTGIAAGADGAIYFGAGGRLLRYVAATGAVEDLGVPVAGPDGGTCTVAATTAHGAWGYQRGHLWCYTYQTAALTDCGPVELPGGGIAGVSDVAGATGDDRWLALAAGGRIGRARVHGSAVVRFALTDLVADGRLGALPGGLFVARSDGTILRIEPGTGAVGAAWNTAPGIARGSSVAWRCDGVIFRAIPEGVRDPAIVAHVPDESAIVPVARVSDGPIGRIALAFAPDGALLVATADGRAVRLRRLG